MKVIRRWRKCYLKTNCSKCNEKLRITKDSINIKEKGSIVVGIYVCPKCKHITFISFYELVNLY